jgi:lipoprotein-anchoring transpeptidase ErfK/SrfK
VKHLLSIVCVTLGLVAAATFAAVSSAATPGSQPGPSTAEPTAKTTQKQVAKTTPASHKAKAKFVQKQKVVTLPASVRIAGVRVGHLVPERAEKVVQRAFNKPLTVQIDKLRLRLDPNKLAKPYVTGAVGHARAATPGTKLPLVVNVHGAAVRAWAKKVADRVNRKPAKVGLVLRHGKPYIGPRAYGRQLDQNELVKRVVHALSSNTRLPVRVTTQSLLPQALPSAKAAVIVINRGANTLALYHGIKPWKTFRVATGQYAYPTPRGRFDIVVKWVNPWWYPPASPWAAGASPVPPGPGNPLGTRWMGLSAPGVGIHGTPNPSSIGYSESHGCIRMYIPQAEWLFDHVEVGTTVFIV